MKKSLHHRTNQCYGLHKPPNRAKVTELEMKEIDVIRSRKSQYAIASWKEHMNKMPLALSLVLLLIAFVFGCKTSLGPLAQQPPLPYTSGQKLIVNVKSSIVPIQPPIQVVVAMNIKQDANLFHHTIYVQSSSNMVDWTTITNYPTDGTINTLYVTNGQHEFFRTGW